MSCCPCDVHKRGDCNPDLLDNLEINAEELTSTVNYVTVMCAILDDSTTRQVVLATIEHGLKVVAF